jgi:hypothetical protein
VIVESFRVVSAALAWFVENQPVADATVTATRHPITSSRRDRLRCPPLLLMRTLSSS